MRGPMRSEIAKALATQPYLRSSDFVDDPRSERHLSAKDIVLCNLLNQCESQRVRRLTEVLSGRDRDASRERSRVQRS
jgi:hypothetical protein